LDILAKCHNLPADRARELFKHSKDSENLVSTKKNWEVLDLNYFVGDVISGVGLGFFGLRHRILGPNPKGQFYDSCFE